MFLDSSSFSSSYSSSCALHDSQDKRNNPCAVIFWRNTRIYIVMMFSKLLKLLQNILLENHRLCSQLREKTTWAKIGLNFVLFFHFFFRLFLCDDNGKKFSEMMKVNVTSDSMTTTTNDGKASSLLTSLDDYFACSHLQPHLQEVKHNKQSSFFSSWLCHSCHDTSQSKLVFSWLDSNQNQQKDCHHLIS